MTDDLERELVSMMAARADDVRSVPERLLSLADDRADAVGSAGNDEVIELGIGRGDVFAAVRRRWPLLVAAAAVLAALGSVLAALAGVSTHPVSPAHPLPAVKSVVRPACSAGVPASWTRVVDRRTPVPHVGSDDVVAVTPSGGLVLQYAVAYGRATVGSARFAYLAPGSRSPRSLGVVDVPLEPHGPRSYEFDVDTDGSTLLVTAESGNRTPEPRVIVAFDLRTGGRAVLTRVVTKSGRRIVGPAYVMGGTAYWQTLPRGRGPGGSAAIVAAPVTGGAARVVAGGDLYLEKSALGVEWNTDEGLPDRPAAVPPVVLRHADINSTPNEVFDTYISDGDVYAWQTLTGALDWYDPKTGELVTVPHLLGVPGIAPGQAALFSVAGPLVYFQDQAGTGDRVLDARTGAVVDVDVDDTLYGAHGTVVGPQSAFTRDRGSSSGLVAVRAADLPPARCGA